MNAAAIAKYGDDDETRSLFVMHPTTKLRRYWDFLQIFLLLYIAISVPYRIGFSEPSYGIVVRRGFSGRYLFLHRHVFQLLHGVLGDERR